MVASVDSFSIANSPSKDDGRRGGRGRIMRIWNITDAETRAKPFEPSAAEIFAVRGRAETREYVAVAFVDELRLFVKSPCDVCSFRTETTRGGKPICELARFVCRPDEREDKRQIVAQRRRQ